MLEEDYSENLVSYHINASAVSIVTGKRSGILVKAAMSNVSAVEFGFLGIGDVHTFQFR